MVDLLSVVQVRGIFEDCRGRWIFETRDAGGSLKFEDSVEGGSSKTLSWVEILDKEENHRVLEVVKK